MADIMISRPFCYCSTRKNHLKNMKKVLSHLLFSMVIPWGLEPQAL